MSKAYRPQSWNGKFKLKNRVGIWHWHERRCFDTHKYRVGGQLHYLACHAPHPIMKKWRSAWNKFFKRYHKSI